MNYYIIVEGERASVNIYKNWIKYLHPELNQQTEIDKVTTNDYIIYGGGGYPSYYNIIANAILDVNSNPNIDKLVVGIDSEDLSYDEKYLEIETIINENKLMKPFSIIIHHFCFETWFLANRKICTKNISNPQLRAYKKIFDTHKNDPELLPNNVHKDWNRSQFAYHYFRALLQEKNKKLSYSKNNPSIVIENYFFNQINKRYTSTDHIRSFNTFLTAFEK